MKPSEYVHVVFIWTVGWIVTGIFLLVILTLHLFSIDYTGMAYITGAWFLFSTFAGLFCGSTSFSDPIIKLDAFKKEDE